MTSFFMAGSAFQLESRELQSDIRSLCQCGENLYERLDLVERKLVDKLAATAFSNACPWDLGMCRLIIGVTLVGQCRFLWQFREVKEARGPMTLELDDQFDRVFEAARRYHELPGAKRLMRLDRRSRRGSGFPPVTCRIVDADELVSASAQALAEIEEIFLAYDHKNRQRITLSGEEAHEELGSVYPYRALRAPVIFAARLRLGERILSADIPDAMRSFLNSGRQ
jgi:hypothetical protein